METTISFFFFFFSDLFSAYFGFRSLGFVVREHILKDTLYGVLRLLHNLVCEAGQDSSVPSAVSPTLVTFHPFTPTAIAALMSLCRPDMTRFARLVIRRKEPTYFRPAQHNVAQTLQANFYKSSPNPM